MREKCRGIFRLNPIFVDKQPEKIHETIGYETDYMRGRREMREEIASGDAPVPAERPQLSAEQVRLDEAGLWLAVMPEHPAMKSFRDWANRRMYDLQEKLNAALLTGVAEKRRCRP